MRKLSEERAKYSDENANDAATAERLDIEWRDPIKELGWAKIDHVLTMDSELSDGAYRTYALLHYYWQQKSWAWPGLETMAELRGVSEGTLSRHMGELVERGLISRTRRAGQSSITRLEDLPADYTEKASATLQKRNIAKTIGASYQKCDDAPIKNDMYKKNQEEEPIEEKPLFGAKPALAENSKPEEQKTAQKQDAPIVVQRKNEIRGILADIECGKKPETANPRLEKKHFVKEIAPLVAAILNRVCTIGEDRAAAGEIFEFRCEHDWLVGRLRCLSNGAGNEFRHSAKDGKLPNAYWVRNRIEREWAEYRREKADAEQREWAARDYAERVRRALAEDDPAPVNDPECERTANLLYLHGPP